MSPVRLRSVEMSIAHSSSVPRTTGSSISLPSQISLAGGSAMGAPRLEGDDSESTDITIGFMHAVRSECQTRAAMDFDLSDDQLALRDGARELLDGLAAPERVRVHTSSGAAFDAALWRAMGGQGWLAIEGPRGRGGGRVGAGGGAGVTQGRGRPPPPA